MFDLPEKITIWSIATEDGLGGRTYSGPFVVDGRFALKQEKFTDINGNQQISKAVCYSRSDKFIAGAYVLLAESAAIEPPAEADDIRALAATPSVTDMRKAWF